MITARILSEAAEQSPLYSVRSDNVGTERPNAEGKVDVVVHQNGRFWFYEIKAAATARGCISEALSQLLEYPCWPGAQMAERLIVAGEPSLDHESERYLATLREQFNLPLEYRRFDLCSGISNASTARDSVGTLDGSGRPEASTTGDSLAKFS